MASVYGTHLDLPGVGEFKVTSAERGFVARGEVPIDGTAIELEAVPVLHLTLEMVSPVERARRN